MRPTSRGRVEPWRHSATSRSSRRPSSTGASWPRRCTRGGRSRTPSWPRRSSGQSPQAAEAAGRHPDLKLTRGVIDISLCTRQDGRWVTQQDLDLARRISEIADEQGLRAEPGAVTQLEIAPDTAHQDRVAAFWSVLLTGSLDNTIYDSVFDPTDRVPSLWFQGTQEHELPTHRWRFDLWLAAEVADERIAAAIAHGGSIVDDAGAPAFTVLADPDGNRVCIYGATGR